MSSTQKRPTTHPDRLRRRAEAEARQDKSVDARQGRKARERELDPALYSYDSRGIATRKPVTR